jgi:DNA-binding MarR family transcriptional regulator
MTTIASPGLAPHSSDNSESPRAHAGDEFAGRVRDIATALQMLDREQRRVRAALAAELGISLSEFLAIIALGQNGDLTPKWLGEELGVTTSAMTAMIDRLERAGLVSRVPHPSDRRSVLIRLSVRGEDARDWIYRRYLAIIAMAAEGISVETESQTIADLAVVAAALAYAVIGADVSVDR